MNNKKFMIVCTTIIGIMFIVLVVLGVIIFNLLNKHNQAPKDKEVAVLKEEAQKTEEKATEEEQPRNSNLNQMSAAEILESFKPNTKIDEFFNEINNAAQYAGGIQEVFLRKILPVYSEKISCDKPLDVALDDLLKINNGYELIENFKREDLRTDLGEEIVYIKDKTKDSGTKNVEIVSDKDANIISLTINNFYTVYDIGMFDESPFYEGVNATPQDNVLFRYMDKLNNSKNLSREEKYIYLTKVINKINISDNNYFTHMFSKDELAQIQEYLTKLDVVQIIKNDEWEYIDSHPLPSFKIKHIVGDKCISIMGVVGSVDLRITNKDYDQSNYVKNYKKLMDYCIGLNKSKAKETEAASTNDSFTDNKKLTLNANNINKFFQLDESSAMKQLGSGRDEYLYGGQGIIFDNYPVWINFNPEGGIFSAVLLEGSRLYGVDIGTTTIEDTKSILGEPAYMEENPDTENGFYIGYQKDNYDITFGSDNSGIIKEVIVKNQN